MFKSAFSKYILTYGLLIFLSFAAIAVITSSIMTGYARENKQAITDKLAEIIFTDVEIRMEKYGSFRAAIAAFNRETTYSDKFAELLDSLVLITDTDGTVLYVSGASDGIRFPHRVPKKTVNFFRNNAGKVHYNNLGGVLPHKYFNTAFPVFCHHKTPAYGETDIHGRTDIPDDGLLGVLFISTPSAGMDATVTYLIFTIVIALAWIFAVSLTALYFIGKRLNEPVAAFRRKIAAFSQGDFSARMEPTGVAEMDTIVQSFNHMAESLEKNELSRRNFLSNVSHDLRTPMTSIQGFLDAILDGTIKPEHQKHYLSVVSKEVKRLSRLVGTLLDVSRMESGTLKLNRTAFDLCEMTRLIVISFEERILDKNIEFSLEADNDRSSVFADKDAIYQVMYNLIENAVKFTDEGGDIRVMIRKKELSDGSGGRYNISVYNTGEGISENARKNIFDRFFKADFSRGEDKNGVGLGLFIVRTNLEAHGERIAVDSEYGAFCRFSFSLPCADLPEEASALPERSGGNVCLAKEEEPASGLDGSADHTTERN